MEIKLGAAIKKLRTEKGATQEELAEYVGVSFQAVSKWETDTTMPDISLLPKLAMFFGVRIDDLFSVNTDDELERIDYMLEHEKLTDENFTYAKRTLDSILRNNEKDVGALKRYARLYLSRPNPAASMLEKAMPLAPLDPEIFTMYRQARGGDNYSARSGNDWFIRVCEPYARKYPANTRLCERLIDAMIEMRYFDRAEEIINLMKTDDEYSACLPDIFRGDIAFAEGNLNKAVTIWSGIDSTNHKAQYEIGERFNRINEYEKAIVCFDNSFKAVKAPRDLSAVYSLAFLYAKLGQYQKAIDSWQCILDVLRSDYNTIEGETVEWPKQEIEKLKAKL
ncbi:MAG: helix-turn-helix domain-containing protein [Oscillospiraceae bacterium]|nr:helix-turn-helix domain-containing protein [Oscillospiraceae bacterium]